MVVSCSFGFISHSVGLKEGSVLYLVVRAPPTQQRQTPVAQATPQPDFMDTMLDNPLTQALLSNTDFVQNMMLNNPQTQRLLEQNPELRHFFNDPQNIRQMVETMRNPNLRQELLRNTDRVMANVESMPGGFNALRRVYENVSPMMDGFDDEPDTSNQTTSNARDDANINTQPLPNPWAASMFLF